MPIPEEQEESDAQVSSHSLAPISNSQPRAAEFEGLASPLTGKKKRLAGYDENYGQHHGATASVHASPALNGRPPMPGFLDAPLGFGREDEHHDTDNANAHHNGNLGAYREESVTPPPLQAMKEDTPSHKRRRSVMHTPQPAPLSVFGGMS